MENEEKGEIDRFGISMPRALKERLDKAVAEGYFSANDRSSVICYCVTLVLDMFDRGGDEKVYRKLDDFITLIRDRPQVLDAFQLLIRTHLE